MDNFSFMCETGFIRQDSLAEGSPFVCHEAPKFGYFPKPCEEDYFCKIGFDNGDSYSTLCVCSNPRGETFCEPALGDR
jgi:hypothetical protein